MLNVSKHYSCDNLQRKTSLAKKSEGRHSLETVSEMRLTSQSILCHFFSDGLKTLTVYSSEKKGGGA